MNRKRPAFTLIEMIVSMALGLLVLGVMITLFFRFRNESETPLASMNMEQSTIQITRWLQREISETNLQSIRSLPNQSGLALESARDNKDVLTMTPYGVVSWKKFVFFQVKPIASTIPLPAKVDVGGGQITPQLGELNYDEDTAGVGVEPAGPPSLTPAANAGRHRALGRNFLIDSTNDRRGCYVYYLDNAGIPHDFTDTQRGEPVCVALTLMDVSGRTGKPTIRKMLLQIKPKN